MRCWSRKCYLNYDSSNENLHPVNQYMFMIYLTRLDTLAQAMSVLYMVAYVHDMNRLKSISGYRAASKLHFLSVPDSLEGVMGTGNVFECTLCVRQEGKDKSEF